MGFWCVSRSALTAATFRLPSVVRVFRGRASVRGCSGGTSRGDEPVQQVCYELSHRTLLKLHGADTSALLQGIVTNDVTLLRDHATLYAHLLNVQGRTLYDVILYRLHAADAPSVLLECDVSVQEGVMKHLLTFRLRRKVTVSPCADLTLWAVLPGTLDPALKVTTPPQLKVPVPRPVVWAEDPRTSLMGWRLVLREGEEPEEVLRRCKRGDTLCYHRYRYSIGVPEGVSDLPPGVALPLESNLVFLRGISFSKGCYIGQELTARTHHTGVVRKRLMPVRLEGAVTEGVTEGAVTEDAVTEGVTEGAVTEGATLETQAGKAAGKYRAGIGPLGLSLVRMAHANETLTLKANDNTEVSLRAAVPPWWPKEEDVV